MENELREIDLGPTTGEELLLGSYEALKNVFAATISQMVSQDIPSAKALYARIAADIDQARAEFILALRESRLGEAVEALLVVEDEEE